MAKAKKVILPPVDVVGRKVSWTPSKLSDKLYGEVVAVKLKPHPHPKYPNSSNRILKTVLHVMIPDGRIFKMSGEMEDLKKIGMVAESNNEE
jgi:hypothetical protein